MWLDSVKAEHEHSALTYFIQDYLETHYILLQTIII
jgi:hypothetical protein